MTVEVRPTVNPTRCDWCDLRTATTVIRSSTRRRGEMLPGPLFLCDDDLAALTVTLVGYGAPAQPTIREIAADMAHHAAIIRFIEEPRGDR